MEVHAPMNQNGHRGACGVFAAAAVVVLLPIILASQVPPPTQGRGQAPPPPPDVVTTIGSRDGRVTTEATITFVGRGRMDALRVPIPADNGLSEARVDLGRRLFFDPVLSKDRSVSCSTCHKPELAFTDERPVAVGIFGRVGKRHSPSLVNRGLGRAQFWDGRAATLEALALLPLRDVNEMDLPPEEAIVRLAADASYSAAFQSAFGRPPSTDDLARALASFVRVVRSENSPYDRFEAGDRAALTADQQRGRQVFRTRGNCTFCHREPMFTDELFHNTGVAWRPNPEGPGGAFQDDGQFAFSKNERDRGKFKTPTLREIARTAPYMHDGSLATLDAVVDFYDKGGRPNVNLFPIIRPLGLSPEEKRVLVTFLESLSGEVTSTMLTRERTSPDFSGTWTLLSTPAGATASVPFWNCDSVSIVQSLGTVMISFSTTNGTPQMVRRVYGLDGAVRRTTDRSLPAGFQQTSTQGAWRDWQLVLTATEFMPAADGTPGTEEIIQVLTSDSTSTLTVQVTRKGAKPESWTLKLQRSDARPR
jgi:cytochrome c peroxidase